MNMWCSCQLGTNLTSAKSRYRQKSFGCLRNFAVHCVTSSKWFRQLQWLSRKSHLAIFHRSAVPFHFLSTIEATHSSKKLPFCTCSTLGQIKFLQFSCYFEAKIHMFQLIYQLKSAYFGAKIQINELANFPQNRNFGPKLDFCPSVLDGLIGVI